MERQVREVERKKAADAVAKAVDEAPEQDATFATPAGTETPAMVADGTVGFLGSAGDATGSTSADAHGMGARQCADDTRATEGTAELVVTPVAESVPRSCTAEVNEAMSETISESVSENVKGDASAPISVDVPHDQQPA
jgi:hypothetical protein